MHQVLFTPWRYAYISREDKGGEGCFLCAAVRAPEGPESLVVHRSDHHLVLLNRHPYTNGHLMVAPQAHCASPLEQEAGARQELWPVVLEALRVLDEAYSPDGLNVGLNLGRAAGAGVTDHFHLHVVPRWSGDSNFMAVTAGTRLVPEDLDTTRERLRRLFGGG